MEELLTSSVSKIQIYKNNKLFAIGAGIVTIDETSILFEDYQHNSEYENIKKNDQKFVRIEVRKYEDENSLIQKDDKFSLNIKIPIFQRDGISTETSNYYGYIYVIPEAKDYGYVNINIPSFTFNENSLKILKNRDCTKLLCGESSYNEKNGCHYMHHIEVNENEEE